MNASAADRTVMFGTSVISHQMQLYLMKRPGYRAAGKEFRMVFSDLSKAAFSSAVISLKAKGIIDIEGDDVVIFPEKVTIPGMILDRCWKAMRMERRFTVESIVNLTGYSPTQVREAIRRMIEQQAVKVLSKTARQPAVYQVALESVARPSRSRGRQSGSKVQKAWLLIRRIESFTFADISMRCNISSRYAKELIQSFRNAGYIEEIGKEDDGHTKVYRAKEGAPKEPPVVKNRTRMKRKGY